MNTDTDAVLIVEDQSITALDLKMILRNCGYYNTVILNKGREAIKYLEEAKPVFALLDIRLADDISGIDVGKKLDSLNIPFIFISAFSDSQNLDRAKELNPVGIISKPIDEYFLMTLVDKLD